MKLKVFDTFAGVGGFSLGLERTGGFETVAFSEIEPYPSKVLAKHWPNVPNLGDIRKVTAHEVPEGIDVITAGFPCTDISIVGRWANREGIDGERSGLWSQVARLTSEIRPSYLIVENTAGLLSVGMGRVLGDLAALGYDAEWHCIPAAYVGARHIRDRVWIVAYPHGDGLEGPLSFGDSVASAIPYDWRAAAGTAFPPDVEDWASEPAFLGKDDDVPEWMDATQSLGNAVVHQIPEMIGHAILAAERERAAA